MPARWWYLQRYNRWVLHCEHFMYCDRCSDVLGLHQASGYADTGVATEGMENCRVDGRLTDCTI
jgi:hypothetical protein